jgi:prepilin-type N-terminal cleavage/methylation domain-containing protein
MEVQNMAAKRDKGFTLVELLVVIAIIALLLSILMPALGRVRRQAQAAACQAALHSWGQIFMLYTNDNNGYFYTQVAPPNTKLWMMILRPYYPPTKGYCCPTATKPQSEGAKGTFSAWGKLNGGWATEPGKWIYGSFGVNDWLVNVNDALGNCWKTINVSSGGNNIPMLLDSVWVDGYPGFYQDQGIQDVPARHEGQFADGVTDNMQRFCINRHNGAINSVFIDSSVRKVNLKGLWKLKWHRNYDTSYPEPDWKGYPWLNKIK